MNMYSREFSDFKSRCFVCEYALMCLTRGRMSKVHAIKARRAETGASLVEAKRHVEEKMMCWPTPTAKKMAGSAPEPREVNRWMERS